MSLIKIFRATKGHWWAKPKLQEDSSHHRQASWLELFFDLGVIACIGQISHGFAADVNFFSLLIFAISVFNVTFVWGSISMYSSRYENQSLRHRLIIFFSMLPLVFLSIATSKLFALHGHETRGILLIYGAVTLILRLFLLFLWEWSAHVGENAAMKTVAHKLSFNTYLPAILLVAVGTLLAQPRLSLLFWSLAMLYEQLSLYVFFLFGKFSRKQGYKKLPALHVEHSKERYGLLSMLVLGEVIISAVNGLLHNAHSIQDDLLSTAVFYLLSMAIVILLWWHYYDYISIKNVILYPGHLMMWRSLHSLIVPAWLLIGALLEKINSYGVEVSSKYMLWLLAALGVFLLCIYLSNFLTDGWPLSGAERREHFQKWLERNLMRIMFAALLFTAALALVLIFGHRLRGDVFLALVMAILLFNALSGLTLWIVANYYTQSYQSESQVEGGERDF